ncbi:MAG: aspartyl protease family protein [Planctomycetes bacterium]|nr:aspartyl protease family protein [Planctomycetota bacterium]
MSKWTRTLMAAVALAALFAPMTRVAAQKAEPPKAEEKPAEAASDKVEIDFNFEGLIFVQAKVNGKGPYEFLFDSGATQSVVNARLAKELALEEHDSPGAVQGVGTAEAKLVVLDSVELGAFKREEVLAASMDLDHMSGTLGRHMMGIVGQNIIRMMQKIELDFSTCTLGMTRYAAGEEPSNMQEEMMVRMLKGGGGIPGLPGGRQPRQPKEEPGEQPKPGKEKEDEFSAPVAPMGEWLFQAAPDKTTESAAARHPKEGMTLTYTTGELSVMGRKMELIPYWYLDVVVNGKNKRFMFDTGASMLLVLDDGLASELAVPESFTYPVKGIGKGDTKSGLLESFQVGVVQETDVACSIMDLPDMTSQLGMLGRLPGTEKLKFDGIVGITLATRFKKMTVNTKDRNIEFTAYGADEKAAQDPFAGEDFVKDCVIRTWNGKAGKFGLSGDSVQLEEWKKHGLETGGMMVEEVEANGAAAKAGIRKGDIITHLLDVKDLPEMEDAKSANGEVEVRDFPALIMFACSQNPGSVVSVRVKRGTETLVVPVTLADYGFKGAFPEKHKAK